MGADGSPAHAGIDADGGYAGFPRTRGDRPRSQYDNTGSPAHAGIDLHALSDGYLGSPAHAGIDWPLNILEDIGSPAHAGIDPALAYAGVI